MIGGDYTWYRVIGGARDAMGLDAVRVMAEGARAIGEFSGRY